MVFERIREALSHQMEIEESSITLETDIIEELGVDSLDLAELMMNLEDEFGIIAADDAIKDIRTVGDVVEYVEKLIS